MLIQQASYGPLNGHSFLAGSTPAMEATFRDAVFITDLQQNIPTGIQWAPFYRLVAYDRWMLLIHTRPAEAGSRAGMVRSRAAFIPKDSLNQISNLEPIAHALSLSHERVTRLQAIEVHEASGLTCEPQGPTALEEGIAGALLRVPSSAWPVVVAEEVDIAQAMFGLWRRVPPDFRPLLTFGLGFDPEGLNGLAVVKTPPALAGRWSSIRLVDIDPSEAPNSKVAMLLSGQDGSGVRNFASEWGLSLESPAAIDLVHRVQARWKSREDFSDDIYLLRILLEKARRNSSTNQKIDEILRRLESSCVTWSTDVLLGLRNVEFDGVTNAEKFQQAIQSRLCSLVVSGDTSDVSSILTAWNSAKARSWWIRVADLSLKEAFQAGNAPSVAMSDALWDLFQTSPDRVEHILTSLGKPPELEAALLSVKTSVLNSELARRLFGPLVNCGYFALAGQVLAKAMPSADCLRTVLSVANGLDSDEKKALFESSLIDVDSESATLCALLVYVETGEKTLLTLAATKAIESPKVFKNFKWGVLAWFELLAKVSAQAPTAEDFIPNGQDGIEKIISERLTTPEIWIAISQTRFANLADLSARAQAWYLMPVGVLPRVLKITAAGWLQSFENDFKLPEELEEPLRAEVFACVTRRGFLSEVAVSRSMVVARYLDHFGLKNDTTAEQLVHDLRFGSPISRLSAEAIGRHFLAHGYRLAAKSAGLQLFTRPDFAPLIKECFPLLGKLNRLWIGPALHMSPGLTSEECWEAFEAEACNIYSLGPTDGAIWARSGGHEDLLVCDGTGREQWHRCVKALRGGMEPGVEALLHQMQDDYRQNGVFRELLNSRFWAW